MELVEGPTLAEVLAGPGLSALGSGKSVPAKGLSLEDALPIAKQIAEALEAAHERGIVHRDLKPANIKVTPDGKVKVLDFGLAKAMEPAGCGLQDPAYGLDLSQAPTLTSPALATRAGVILGTAAYMSPEQARGKTVDKRTDIWAFGCVFYEMLSGKRAFGGADVADVLARIIEREPDWASLQEAAPQTIRTLLRRCLKKDVRERVPDIGMARLEIGDALSAGVETPIANSAPSTIRALRMVLVGVSTALALAVIGWIAPLSWRSPSISTVRAPMRLLIAPPADKPLVTGPVNIFIAVSPDGQSVVYRGGSTVRQSFGQAQLMLRRIDGLDVVAMPGTAYATDPFFSPDGRWVAFFAAGELKKVPLAGGSPVSICKVTMPNPRGGTWSINDVIVFGADTDGLIRVSAAGGTTTALTTPQSGRGHVYPTFLPDGETLLFTVLDKDTLNASGRPHGALTALNLPTGEERTLIDGATSARYIATGHLAYLSGTTLWSVPFDQRRLRTTADPVSMAELVAVTQSGGGNFDASSNGIVAYVPARRADADSVLVWVDRDGREEVVNAPPRG